MKADKETTRDFLRRFNKEKVGIPHCDVHTAIEAFRQGLPPTGELYRELTKYPCKTFEDVQAKAMAEIRYEEDLEAEQDMSVSDDDDEGNCQKRICHQKEHRFHPYHR